MHVNADDPPVTATREVCTRSRVAQDSRDRRRRSVTRGAGPLMLYRHRSTARVCVKKNVQRLKKNLSKVSSFFLRGVSIQLREVESLSFVTCVRRARKAGNHTAHAHCSRSRFQTTTTGEKKIKKSESNIKNTLSRPPAVSVS